MEKLGKVVQLSLDAIGTWQERFKERQESLSGVPTERCLVNMPAAAWYSKMRGQKAVVAAMCLAEGECEACLKFLQHN